MKYLVVALIIIGLAVTSLAQASVDEQAAPGVTVTKAEWRKHQYYEGWDSPFHIEGGNKELPQPDYRQNRKPEDPERVTPNNEARPLDSKQTQARNLSRSLPAKTSRGRFYEGYLYEVVVQNTGSKSIKAIQYDYVFIDPNSQRVVASHQFQMTEEVSPGKKKKAFHFSTTQPTRVVSAASPEGNAFIERVIINRIEYSDGTVWERT